VAQPTSNESPVLPPTAPAAVSRGAALLELIYAAATDPEADPKAALEQIAGMCSAGIADIARWAPAGMRAAAADAAQQYGGSQ
jgi:hypothetical protein